MIIKRLKITKLYGIYNYDIIFNDDLSFLYGVNGSGKTTILNILTYIIKGKFYDLRQYKFEECTLFFNNLNNEKSITISQKDTNNLSIKSNYFNLNFKISLFRKDRLYPTEHKEHRNLKSYINSFNYLFLPLSREAFVNILKPDLFLFQEPPFIEKNSKFSDYKINLFDKKLPDYQTYLDSSLINVKKLIKNHCFMIAKEENHYNEIFRKELIETLLSVDVPYNINEAFQFMYKENIMHVLEEKQSLVTETIKKFFTGNDSTSTLLIDKISKKFDVFRNSIQKINNHKSVEYTIQSVEYTIQYLWHYGEIKKLESLYKLGLELSQKKDKIYQRKELFLNIINSFFYLSQNYKEININPDGDINLFLNYQGKRKSLDIQHLSSGEKHLIIIFANLIFNMKETPTGIYIVDEPEASLHLKWQAIFVKSLKKVTNNIQLIFATHSPEIINKYRDKMIKIQADINGSDFDE